MNIPEELQFNNELDNQSVMPPRFNDREESPEIGVIRELSPKKVKEQIRMELKGYSYDYEEKKYIKIEGEVPMMNELGIQKYISCLSAVTDTVTFSNYTLEDAKAHTLFVMESVIPTLYINYKDYGITSKCDLPVLTSKLFNLTYAAFMKAVGAGDRGVIGRTIQESIMTRAGQQQFQQPQQKGGIFNNINPFKR
jgi:hypothetical protein